MITDKGIDFVTRHEGFVSKAYRDPVGIITIGTGFTNRSKTAAKMLGPIKLGMTITREQNDRVLKAAFLDEYGPPVDREFPMGKPDHVYDAGYSYVFNCGAGALSDKWVKKLKGGSTSAAADALLLSRVTAKGKRLPGLVRRRKEEASLLEFGDYGIVNTSRSEQVPKPKVADEELQEYQDMLNELGYDCGEADGWHGPQTTSAIIGFQRNQPNLKADGILGPATKAAIKRAIAARNQVSTGTIIAGGTAAGGVATKAVQEENVAAWGWIVAAVVAVAIVGFIAFKWRDEIKHWLKG